MPYQAIIFDLDGTLRESNPHFMDALNHCLIDQEIVVESFQWRLTERWVHHYWAQSPELLEDIKLYGADAIWTRFIYRLMEHVGHPPADEEVEEFALHVRGYYQPESHVIEGVCETLDALSERGVTMGVLSNREHTFVEELESLGISRYFDFTLAAGEIGIWKPRPEIFVEALARAGNIPAASALYVGDNYYADIVGARNAGLDALLIDSRHVFTDCRCPRIEQITEVAEAVEGLLVAQSGS